MFGLAGCSSDVSDAINESAFYFSSRISSVIQVSTNTTQENQRMCAKGNRIRLRVSLPTNEDYLCLDQTKLTEGLQEGLLCSGGETISKFTVNSQASNCKNIELCGKPPVKAEVIGKRLDGGEILELSFEELPWGCEGKLVFDTKSDFDKNASPSIAIKVTPPECPFCPRLNERTCLPCEELTENEVIQSGQVVNQSCEGEECEACPMIEGTIPH